MARRLNTFDRIVRTIGEAEKTRRAELRHMYAVERERAKKHRQRERVRERTERARQQARADQQADAEFAEWSDREEELAAVAVPERDPAEARERLLALSKPETYQERPFDEHAFDYEVPRGPNARIVEAARNEVALTFSIPAYVEPGSMATIRVFGWIGLAAGAIGAFTGTWALALPAFAFAAFWGIREYAISDEKQSHDRTRAEALAEEHRRASEEARKQYTAKEVERRERHAANERKAREKFDEEQRDRVAAARAALAGETKGMQSMLDAFFPLQGLPVTACFAVTAVEDAKTVALVVTAPPSSELPTQKARRVLAGVTYRDKNQAELSEQYRRVVSGLALRHVAEVFALLPSVQIVRADVYEERADAMTGKDVMSCIVAMEAERNAVEDLNFDAAEPEAAVAGLGGDIKWRKGQYVEQDGVTGMTGEDVTKYLEDTLKEMQAEREEEMKDPKKRRDYELLDLLQLVGKKRSGNELSEKESKQFEDLSARYPGKAEEFDDLGDQLAEDDEDDEDDALNSEEEELRELIEEHHKQGIGYVESLNEVLELTLKYPGRAAQFWRDVGGESVRGEEGPESEIKTLREIVRQLISGNGLVASWGNVDPATRAGLPPDTQDSKWGSVMLKFMLKYPYWTEKFIREFGGREAA